MSKNIELAKREMEIEELRYQIALQKAEKEFLRKQVKLTNASNLAHCKFLKTVLLDQERRV